MLAQGRLGNRRGAPSRWRRRSWRSPSPKGSRWAASCAGAPALCASAPASPRAARLARLAQSPAAVRRLRPGIYRPHACLGSFSLAEHASSAAPAPTPCQQTASARGRSRGIAGRRAAVAKPCQQKRARGQARRSAGHCCPRERARICHWIDPCPGPPERRVFGGKRRHASRKGIAAAAARPDAPPPAMAVPIPACSRCCAHFEGSEWISNCKASFYKGKKLGL